MLVYNYLADWKIVFLDSTKSVIWETLLVEGKYDYDFDSFQSVQQPNNVNPNPNQVEAISSGRIGENGNINDYWKSWSASYIWIGIGVLFSGLRMKPVVDFFQKAKKEYYVF